MENKTRQVTFPNQLIKQKSKKNVMIYGENQMKENYTRKIDQI